jgi:hypothetical protein
MPKRLLLLGAAAVLALTGCDVVAAQPVYDGGGVVIVHHSPSIVVHHYVAPVRVYTRPRTTSRR